MSFSEWKYGQLDEVAEIIMGQSPTGDTCNEIGNGTPLLNGPTEFGDFYPAPVQFTTDPKKISQIGDLLFCVRGSTTGRMNWSNQEFAIGRGLAALRHKQGYEYKHFLKGIIDVNLTTLLAEATGSTFPNVSGQQLKNLKIFLPDLKTQQRIASILSSLDDAIELNQQINKTLGDMAKAIFKEWFVDFNFPNATGKFQETEIGKIPVGWKVGKLGDIYKTTSGGTPSRAKLEYYENGIYQWVKSKELNNSFIIDTEEKITADALKKSSAKLVPKYSVMIAMYGATVGEIGIISNEATCNQAICAFLPNNDYPFSFIYQFLLLNKQDIIGQAVGSAQQNISQQLLLNYALAIPPSETVKAFHKIVEPLFFQIEQGIKENQSLTNLRDTLLPKLMKGEIEINSKADVAKV